MRETATGATTAREKSRSVDLAPTRRAFLRMGGVATASTLSLGAVSTATAQGVEYDGWFDDVQNFSGETVDARGQDRVTVEVGADGNGGTYAFSPPAIRIDPGTTVNFEWVSNTHNVLPESVPEGASWEGHSTVDDAGTTYEHVFEQRGSYTYYCAPHRALGMKGAVVVGDVGLSGGGGSGGPSLGTPELTIGAVLLASVAFIGGTIFGSRLRERDVSDAGLTVLVLSLIGVLAIVVVVSKLIWGW